MDITKVCAKKLTKMDTELRVSKMLIEMYEYLEPHVKQDDKKLFKLACVNPVIRRKQKALAGLEFWSDPVQVQKWFETEVV